MTSLRGTCSLQRDKRGATAAEFALVLPVLLLFLFGIIDAGRMMWTWNRAETATQAGARMATVTDMVPGGLYAADFSASLGQAQVVPASSFGSATCQKPAGSVTCACNTGQTCPALTPIVGSAFDNIVTRMQRIYPELTADKVRVDYANSGLGYSGDPNGADVAPFITVRLVGMTFHPITGMLLGATVSMPEFRATLTMEDGSGTTSN